MSHREISAVLQDWSTANPQALGQLMPEVIDDLRRLARHYFSRESPGHTLQPTALVNEVYLRLANGKVGRLEDRSQFFAFAARLMREILVDHARARRTAKRGGGVCRIGLEDARGVPDDSGPDLDALLALDEALDRLQDLDPRQRAIVELRHFAGLSLPEIAEVLGISLTTVERSWRVARCWLAREIG